MQVECPRISPGTSTTSVVVERARQCWQAYTTLQDLLLLSGPKTGRWSQDYFSTGLSQQSNVIPPSRFHEKNMILKIIELRIN
jgi:hypothetical protein